MRFRYSIRGRSIMPGNDPTWVYLCSDGSDKDPDHSFFWSINLYNPHVIRFESYYDAAIFMRNHPDWCFGCFIYCLGGEYKCPAES